MSGSSPSQEAEGQQRARLVAAVLWLVQEWRRVLDMGTSMPRPALEFMRTRSRELQASARGVGFGGIALHLERATAACEPPLDAAEVRAALDNVWEITRHAREELDPAARRQVDEEHAALSIIAPAADKQGQLAPPPLITVYPRGGPADAGSGRSNAPPVADPRWTSSPPPKAEFGRVSTPVRAESEAAPNLQVRTMFGLRAFGRNKSETPRRDGPRESAVLGLKKASSQPRRVDAPPQLLSSPLPPLARPGSPSSGGDRQTPLSRDRQRPPEADPIREVSTRRKKATRPDRKRSEAVSLGPWLAALGVGALAVIGATIFIVVRQPSSGPAVASAGAASVAPAEATTVHSTAPVVSGELPRSKLLTDDEQFRSLLSQIHGRGGKESPELRALLDEQAAVQSKLLKAGKCEDNAACSEWEKARGLLTAAPAKPITHRRRPATDGMAPAWMNGLRLPDKLPIEDDPLVKRYFQQYAENRVGRETLQSMLFRCGAYRDLIRATLIRYDVPEGVLALVLVESGCEPLARSPVGALGMWQFMPDSGRGYGLRLIDNVLDERQSPTKSTEAGVHFLSDLYAKLGSWDLVFASYNLGPFGLLARLHKAGDDASFWDLVDADMLPDETAQYVPRIEALALILSNLQRLRFAGLQMRAPDDTADLEVTASTRLSLIARAAATSTDEIRRKNRDILGDRTPSLPGERFSVQVPSSVVEQARDTLQDLRAHSSDEDMCVPSSFDWGRQRFTPEMAEACKKHSPQAEPSVAPPP